MAQVHALPGPEFALGGTIYPVDPDFDWSADKDVLVDAIRQTHEAMRMHHFATLTPDRLWLDCECPDPADHRDLLMRGHAALVETVLTLEPEVVQKRARSLPVMRSFLSMVQGAAFLFLMEALPF